MAEEDKNADPAADAALEQEIRRGRKFSLNDALGRVAGQGMMKGGSPVSPQQQAEFEIDSYLRLHISDASGILAGVLLRDMKRSDALLQDPTKPLKVLAVRLKHLLHPQLLEELVREADMEWGRRLGERPHFQKEGQPPHPDDPYSLDSVRTELERLLTALSAE